AVDHTALYQECNRDESDLSIRGQGLPPLPRNKPSFFFVLYKTCPRGKSSIDLPGLSHREVFACPLMRAWHYPPISEYSSPSANALTPDSCGRAIPSIPSETSLNCTK